MKRRRLGSVLAFFFAATAAAVAATVSLLVGEIASQDSRRRIGEELEELASQLRDRLDAGMGERLHDLQLIAAMQQADEPSPRRGAEQQVLEKLKASFAQYSWIGFADVQGRVLYSTGHLLEGVDVAERPWFRNGLLGPFAGDVHEAKLLARLLPRPDNGEPLRFVDVATPVLGADGAIQGVLGAHLSWEWARRVVDRTFHVTGTVREIEVFILSRDGKVLLAPPGKEKHNLPEVPRGAVSEILSWSDGQPYLTAISHSAGFGSDYHGLGWQVAVRQPIEVAYQPIRQLQWAILLCGVIAALGFALLGTRLARSLSQPLLELAQAADRLRLGEPDVCIPETDQYREAARLSASLRHLVEGLTSESAKLATLNASLEEQVRDRTEMLDRANQHLLGTLQERDELVNRLKQLANTDSLTGLLNRRAFFERADQERRRAERHGTSLAAVALDIDHFKRVNDQHGHTAGDEVLKALARTCHVTLRDVDLIARFGGEEFMLLLPDASLADAIRVAERLRQTVAALQVPLPAGGTLAITISLGAAVHRHGLPLGELLDQADHALYAAKRAGRNRVEYLPDDTVELPAD
ncbi:diguanylate cyclase [Chitiniphilus shinanonensis]|uniref:diguanylate cyclase n=1 Tax=Chitiniphilus shinanonensis TaxID=553088 RepID=A0ABQ6BTA8_9NEIS|nr:sensor domain-containing diguanylate cyclase [Chitiniphilus shinanonensis]GLS04873.1 diguanylate cyclase [Chitiniphilus shinanonensis]